MDDLPSHEEKVKSTLQGRKVVPAALLSLVLAIIGLHLGYDVFARWQWQNVERNWSSTDGIIEGAFLRETSGHGHVNWEAGWTYSYIINGKKYEADSTALKNAYFVHMSASKSQAEDSEMVRSVGRKISVYYDPKDPKCSVLDFVTDDFWDWIILSVSGISLAPAISMMYTLYKKIPNLKRRV